ncbi:hypothetical protein QQ020_27700 [Fulvivirgaceae bacterium BMA12]|uniref:Uncharacterized protein n=1 Tax=Agaribacillus aureus TaxID=3051825 RepID=A0ABT8LDN5_9BACT|nr:hypothetical protein [Fulvivirgaceae bacterium BMA12]
MKTTQGITFEPSEKLGLVIRQYLHNLKHSLPGFLPHTGSAL